MKRRDMLGRLGTASGLALVTGGVVEAGPDKNAAPGSAVSAGAPLGDVAGRVILDAATRNMAFALKATRDHTGTVAIYAGARVAKSIAAEYTIESGVCERIDAFYKRNPTAAGRPSPSAIAAAVDRLNSYAQSYSRDEVAAALKRVTDDEIAAAVQSIRAKGSRPLLSKSFAAIDHSLAYLQSRAGAAERQMTSSGIRVTPAQTIEMGDGVCATLAAALGGVVAAAALAEAGCDAGFLPACALFADLVDGGVELAIFYAEYC
jgi:hypothetical protein